MHHLFGQETFTKKLLFYSQHKVNRYVSKHKENRINNCFVVNFFLNANCSSRNWDGESRGYKSFSGRCGILLLNSNNCNIYQNNLTNNNIGIEMVDRSSRNRIIENHLENNHMALELSSVNPGSDNTISANLITNNTNGMVVKDFVNTNILGNKLVMNEYALVIGAGSGSILRNNTMTDNTYGFKAFNVQDVEVDTSNTVNGKPIYYWVNQRGKTVPDDAGYVALIGCTEITVKNLYFTGNLEGVFLGSTTNSTIVNNRLSGNFFGINLDASHNNTISGNIVTNNQNGIGLTASSSNNTVYGNEITANASAVFIDDSSGNSIIGNNITNSETGVYTQYCGINMIHHNNFINNMKNWDDEGLAPFSWGPPVSVSVWDDGKEGNYWSDYNGTDNNGDGIGDTAYILSENNQDNYPLVNVIPEFPSWAPMLLVLTVLASSIVIYKGRLLKTPIHHS
jgi:parallel beta-helix repeat protein